MLIAYEAVSRFFAPVSIGFREAIPIAFLGLAVNVASAWLLSVGHHHGHDHAHHHHHHDHDHSAAHDHPHSAHATHRDNNMRAALVHVLADAAVSVLVIAGLLLARAFDWPWMDPLVGILGAGVIVSWSYRLIRDTGGILLDRNPEPHMTDDLRHAIEKDGDRVADLHLWRLGPGHLGAIVSIVTRTGRDIGFYRARLARFRSISHLTIELQQD